MKKITKEELEVFLRKHKLWLEDNPEGERANLYEANLYEANLYGADLRGADLYGAYLDKNTYEACPIVCPEEGAFIGFKKAIYISKDGVRRKCIVKLQILKDAKRSSATTSKCRCSKAKVLSITELDGSDSGMTKAVSDYDTDFIYTVGKTVSVKDFNDNRWNECAPGIHFFITRQEAVNY